MSPLIFSACGRSFDGNQILQAADFRGELRRLYSIWLPTYIAAGQTQAEEDENAEPNEAILDGLASDFRYARNLVTAEECEQWLAALGLTSDDFADHILRCGLAGVNDLFASSSASPVGQASRLPVPGASRPSRAHAPDAESKSCDTPHGNEPPMDEEQIRSFRIDLILSQEFHRIARALAWRLALNCEDTLSPDRANTTAQEPQLAESPNANSPSAKSESCLRQWQDKAWEEELPMLEARFQAASQALLTPENQRRALASLRLPLMRLNLEILELESEAAASEAFLCAKEDGISLEALAAENRHAFRSVTDFLEAFPEDWQSAVLSASPGAVLRPFRVGDGFQLCRLLSKKDPSLADPTVLSRVDASLLSAHFQELENRHIRWHVNLELDAS